MTIRLLVAEIRRYARGVRAPAGALLVLGGGRAVAPDVRLTLFDVSRAAADSTAAALGLLMTLWSIAALGAIVWLLVELVGAARQPTRDAEAAERLQGLRDRTLIEGHVLVEIHRTLWATQAGQRAVVVNVTTGEVSEIWLPDTCIPDGSFAVITTAGGRTGIVGWAGPEEIASACRDRHRRAIRPLCRQSGKGLQRAMTAALLAEAEKATQQ